MIAVEFFHKYYADFTKIKIAPGKCSSYYGIQCYQTNQVNLTFFPLVHIMKNFYNDLIIWNHRIFEWHQHLLFDFLCYNQNDILNIIVKNRHRRRRVEFVCRHDVSTMRRQCQQWVDNISVLSYKLQLATTVVST